MIAKQDKRSFDKILNVYKKIEAVYNDGPNYFRNKEMDAVYGKKLSALYKERFGLNLKISIRNDRDIAYISIPHYFETQNILYPAHIRSLIKKDPKVLKKVSKSMAKVRKHLVKNPTVIDLENAKISGGYAIAPSHMVLDIKYLLSKGTDAEGILAISLHETGHLVTHLEFINRETSTNLLLIDCISALTDKTTAEGFRKRVKKQVIKYSMSDKISTNMSDSTKTEIVVASVALESLTYMDSETGSMNTNAFESEKLADRFSTQCGYGVNTIKALVNMDTLHTDKTKSILSHALSEIFAALRMVVMFIVYALVTSGLSIVFMAWIIMFKVLKIIGRRLSVFAGNEDTLMNTTVHPTLEQRSAIIRNQLTFNIKNLGSLTKKEVKDILREIDGLDEADKLYAEKLLIPTTLVDKLMVILFHNPEGNTISKDTKVMLSKLEHLETMANNSLYVTAARFLHEGP